MLRLNTALPATPYATQAAAGKTANGSLGAALCFKAVAGNTTPGALKTLDTTLTGCDPAGFPNGRRPGDDVVDIELRAMMGYLYNNASDAPAGSVGFTDAVHQSADQFVEADATHAGLPLPDHPDGRHHRHHGYPLKPAAKRRVWAATLLVSVGPGHVRSPRRLRWR